MSVITKYSGRFATCGLALGIVTALASTSATAAPTIQVDIAVLGGTGGPFADSYMQVGTPTATPGVFNFSQAGSPYPGGQTGPGGEWSINYFQNGPTGDDDPSGVGSPLGAFLQTAFSITNNMAEVPGNNEANHLYFSIYISMDVMSSENTQFFGSAAINFSAPDGSGPFNQVTAVGGPMFSYLIDDLDVASLFAAGSNLGTSGPGGNSTSANLDGGPLAGIIPNRIGIRIDFDLTPGDTVIMSGSFAFIPAPGCLALLSLAGLAGRSRRRNA